MSHDHDHGLGHGREGAAGAGQDDDDHAHGGPEVAKDAPLGPARKRIDVGGGVEYSYVDEGNGPVVVLLHGFPTSCALWRGVIGELSKTFRCVAPDLLGLGDTACPIESDYGLERQAELVLALVQKLGVKGEFALVGHDWGGAIAQVIATTAPERLSHLVLVDTPAYDAPVPVEVERLCKAARWSFVWDVLCDTGFLRWFASSGGGLRAGAYDPSALSDEAIAEYIRPLYRDTPPAYREGRERFRRAMIQIEGEMNDLCPSVAGGLKKFEKPTLVVWGCDDPYISVSYGKKLADEIPGCAGFELIPFCGHWVPEEKPQVLAGLIAGHLTGAGVKAVAVGAATA